MEAPRHPNKRKMPRSLTLLNDGDGDGKVET